MPRRLGLVAAVALVVAASAVIAARAPLGVDYTPSQSAADNPAPQIDALTRLDLDTVFEDQSPLGAVSLVVRAPFAVLASEHNQLDRYRLGTFPCVLALGLAALAFAARMRRRGARPWHCALVVGIALLAPPIHDALVWGHPEELLTTALVLAAVLLADSRRPLAAGLVVGLAVATKPWALVAVLPVLLLAATRAGRRDAIRGGAAALIAAALLIAPFALANSSSFRRAATRANRTASVRPLDVWWLTSSRHVRVTDGVRVRSVHRPKLSPAVERGARTAILLIAAALALAAAWRGAIGLRRALLLLAAVFLVRCALDPGDQVYYHVPFVVALACWEVASRRPPIFALAASVLLSSWFLRRLGSDLDAINAVYLLWAIPALLALGWLLLRPPHEAAAA